MGASPITDIFTSALSTHSHSHSHSLVRHTQVEFVLLNTSFTHNTETQNGILEESTITSESLTIDLYPPLNSSEATRPVPNPKLITRLDKLRETLSDIAISVENRKILIRLGSVNNKYHMYSNAGWKWKTDAENDERTFNQVLKDIASTDANQLTSCMLEGWENKVEALRLNTLNQSDRLVTERKNWNVSWLKGVTGTLLKEDWNFKDAEGKGPGPDEEVPPKDPKQRYSMVRRISRHLSR